MLFVTMYGHMLTIYLELFYLIKLYSLTIFLSIVINYSCQNPVRMSLSPPQTSIVLLSPIPSFKFNLLGNVAG